MEIEKKLVGDTLKVEIIGRLDAVTALEFDKDLKISMEGVKTLELNCDKLVYIASAGLRILLKYQKFMDGKGGTMLIENVQPNVREVLDMTGFSDFLHIADDKKKLSVEF